MVSLYLKDGLLLIVRMDYTEKIVCTSCRCKKTPDKFIGGNTCCYVCQARGRRYREKNAEKIREDNKKWASENSEHKKAYRKEYNQKEKECEVCNCRVKVSGWAKHGKTNKHLENMK